MFVADIGQRFGREDAILELQNFWYASRGQRKSPD